jgi:hypothetical protein
MVDPLSYAVASLRIVNDVKKLIDGTSASMDSDPGRAYTKLKTWINERAVMFPWGVYEGTKTKGVATIPCESTSVQAIQSLYEFPIRRGVVNVLYDLPGTGKSMGAIAVLQDYFDLSNGKQLKGIMLAVGNSTERHPYVEMIEKILEMSNVEGWLHLLLFVLSQPQGEKPSLLVLDDFVLDDGGENLGFITQLYKCLNPPGFPTLNVVVVVITQFKDAADALYNLNGGQRVRPIEGFCEPDASPWSNWPFLKHLQNRHLTRPTWRGSRWTRSLLLKVLEYNFTRDQLNTIEDKEFAFIREDMTPYTAKTAVEALLDTETVRPKSPSKAYRPGGAFFPDALSFQDCALEVNYSLIYFFIRSFKDLGAKCTTLNEDIRRLDTSLSLYKTLLKNHHAQPPIITQHNLKV